MAESTELVAQKRSQIAIVRDFSSIRAKKCPSELAGAAGSSRRPVR